MPRRTFVLNEFTGSNNVKDSRDIADQEVASSSNFMFDKQGALRTAGKFSAYTLSNLSGDSSTNAAGNGLFYLESDRSVSASTARTTGTYYPIYGAFYTFPNALSIRSSTLNDAAWNAFSVGDKIKITGSSVGNNGIYVITKKGSSTVLGITTRSFDLAGSLITTTDTSNITITSIPRYGEKIWIKPKSTGTAAANMQIKVWNSNETSWAEHNIQTVATDDAVNGDFKPRYFYADLALRVSDSNFANMGRIKWFGFIERNHFRQDPYIGWEVKNNTLSSPTYGKMSSAYPTSAGQINWGIVMAATGSNENESTWVEGSYELGVTNIYDGNQESKIRPFSNGTSTENEFTVASGENVKITSRVLAPFDSRLSGARLYCRARGPEIGESDEDWSFLADLDFSKGIKTSLSSDYKVSTTNYAWHSTSTAEQYISETSTSVRQNADTYESINGFPSDIDAISLGNIGDSWGISCVASRRVFIANINIYDAQSGSSKKYGDRIMYSEIGKYDTFPSYNFIDVVKGDAEEYVELVEYGDRLLAFKHNTLFVLNIANPSPTAWFLEKTFKHKGIKHPGAVFRTDDGVIWVNEAGCWAYNGEQIQNLIDNKLDPIQSYSSSVEHGLSWKDFYNASTILGYSPRYQQILVLKDCTGTTNNHVYCYDIRTKSWALLNDATNFFTNAVYSNFVLDGDGELAIMTTGGIIRYYAPASAATSTQLITKYIDFGMPNQMKKVYKVAVTYKSSVAQADILSCRYINKTGAMANSDFLSNPFDSLSLVVADNWEVAVFEPTSSLSCQSIQFKIEPPNSGTLDINEIMVYYRPKKTIVKSSS